MQLQDNGEAQARLLQGMLRHGVLQQVLCSKRLAAGSKTKSIQLLEVRLSRKASIVVWTFPFSILNQIQTGSRTWTALGPEGQALPRR